MTRDDFKLTHSELIMEMQMIENDLRYIYAAMKPGDFESNADELGKANLGVIISTLKKLDYSDGYPDLSEADYSLLQRTREIRNYWCHQCYIDYIYISDDCLKEEKFEEIANRLVFDERHIWLLHEKIEKLRNTKLKEYRSL